MYSIIISRTFRSLVKDIKLPDVCWVTYHIPYLIDKKCQCDCIDHCKYTPPSGTMQINVDKKYIEKQKIYA